MSSEEIITSEATILECLNEVTRSGRVVYLTRHDNAPGRVYESRLQSLQPKDHYIILHQVLPGDWREAITPETKLEIRSCMSLGHVKFAGYLSPLDDSGNNPYCRLSFPSKIYRKQQRSFFRVSLATTDACASLQLDDERVVHGKCKDFSIAGALFVLPLRTTGIEVGQVIAQCGLVIEDMLDLQCRGKICSLQTTEKEILAGIQFLDLTAAQSKPINAALHKIERQNINT